MGRMTLSPDVEALLVGRIDPHIYAFRTRRHYPYHLKVGFTGQPVDKRLSQWREVFRDLVEEGRWSSVVDREEQTFFKDHAVHTYLVQQRGRKRLEESERPEGFPYSNELFKDATTGDVDDSIADIQDAFANDERRGIYKYYNPADGKVKQMKHYKRSDEYWTLRDNQQKVVERFVERINAGKNHLLMYAVMRFGKSFTALCCATQQKEIAGQHQLVVVVSAKADVKDEWQFNVEYPANFGSNSPKGEYKFVTKDDLANNAEETLDKMLSEANVVCFFTLWDFLDITKQHLRPFFENQRPIDLLIIDETHYGARGDKLGRALDEEDEDDPVENKVAEAQNLSKLNATIKLHLSGTPYSLLLHGEFSDDELIADCQYSDIAEAQAEWDRLNNAKPYRQRQKEWENPYYGFPQMLRFAFNPSKQARELLDSLKKDGKDCSLSELFAIQKNGVLKNKAAVLELLQSIDGTEDDSEILPFLDYPSFRKGHFCQHIVMVLPSKAACDAVEKLLKTETFTRLKEYEIINITGYNSPFSDTLEIRDKISLCAKRNKKTLSLTVKKMLTGVTVREWDTMIFLKGTKSAQEYDQAIYRLQSQYVLTYDDEENKLTKRNMKPQTLLVDFDPQRMFEVQEYRCWLRQNHDGNDGDDNLIEQYISRDMKYSPIIALNIDRLEMVKPVDLVERIRQYSAKRNLLDDAAIIPAEDAIFENGVLLNAIKAFQPLGSKGGLKSSPHEGDGTNYKPDNTPATGQNADNEQQNTDTQSKSKPVQEDEAKLLRRRLATFRALVLLYTFLAEDELSSLRDVIASIERTEDNRRIARNIGLLDKLPALRTMQDITSGAVKKAFNYSISEINRQKPKTGADVETQIDTVFRKVCRFSQAEIITPQWVARKMIDLLPEDIFEGDGKVLDIASKQGEFAFALLKRYGDGVKDRIYSLPTSSLTFEVVRRVYQLLGMPVENILFEREGKPNFTTQLIYTKAPELQESKQELLNTLRDMNFIAIAGNPPYQLEGASGGTNDAPVYQDVAEAAFNSSRQHSIMITPSRWFSGGRKGLLGDFRRRMLTCGHVKNIYASSDSNLVFDGVEIKGGVSYFSYDSLYKGNCSYSLDYGHATVKEEINLSNFDILIRDPRISKIVGKVKAVTEKEGVQTVDTVVSSDTPFGIPTNPTANKKQTFNVYSRSTAAHNTKLFYIDGTTRRTTYVSREDINKNIQDIDKYKVIIPEAYGAGESFPHQILGKPEYGGANTICSQSYLYIAFDNEEEAKAMLKYIKTRFLRFLVLAIKNTQHAMSSVYRFVPLEDLTSANPNIDWTKSITEIDDQLYDKYGLTQPERNFIKSMIKPM